jgi:hypothetical protein
MTSRRPSSPRTRRFPLLVEPPAGIEPATHPYHSCPFPANTGTAQVKVTRMTVAERMAPRAPFWDGTEMARTGCLLGCWQASSRGPHQGVKGGLEAVAKRCERQRARLTSGGMAEDPHCWAGRGPWVGDLIR